jgi:bleomycin hydrolase
MSKRLYDEHSTEPTRASKRLTKKRILDDSFNVSELEMYKKKFYDNDTNKLIQNSLCSSFLHRIAEERDYMQSRDNEFSHVLDPELQVTDQGLSGRCWLFAVLNVMRHELVRKYQLPRDFELSESYLCFYEKIEKCNYFLTKIMEMDELDSHDSTTQRLLLSGGSDGGYWVSCANLIRKYGIVPKTAYRESINSFSTGVMKDIISKKLNEFALVLTNEKDKTKRLALKKKMMEDIYVILCKMLGTPPALNEKFTWSYTLHLDLTDKIAREHKRKLHGEFENLQIKNTVEVTPLEFYQKFIVNNLNNYAKFSNDPRNEYDKYYESPAYDIIVEGEKFGFYNLPMDQIIELCITSIINNTPVEFDCDVINYINPDVELLDTKCYNYSLIFGKDFDKLSKKDMLTCLSSYPTHAMVLVGVDLDEDGKPLKWKVENSWGRSDESTGYYTMSHDWFLRFVYNVVIQKDYVPKELLAKYDAAMKHAVILPENDILGGEY